MLGELYRYAIDHELTARPGFKPKRPKAYILISGAGKYIGVDTVEKTAEPVLAPDIGAAANGTKFCNPLIEKACIPLCIIIDEKKDKNIPTKHEFYKKVLNDGSNEEPLFGIALRALSDERERGKMIEGLTKAKIKPSDPIGFTVDGTRLESSRKYLDWWGKYRSCTSEKTKNSGSESGAICLITGNNTPPMETVPKVPGLMRVGGHTSGDAFLCFDKDAFQSYGLKKSFNASVSEEAMTAVNAALTKLIGEAGVLGGAKIVHWYSADVPEENDPIPSLLGFNLFDGDEDEENPDTENKTALQTESQKRQERELRAMQKSEALCKSVLTGELPELGNARYYIMPLSGANGRMMVRGWQEGSFSDLCRSFNSWFDDLRLITPDGKGMARNPKLMALMVRLLKPGGDDKKVFDRVNSELSNLSIRILQSVLAGPQAPVPDEVPVKALHWIYSAMLSSAQKDEDNGNKKRGVNYETLAFQWLKIWLVRRQRAKGAKIYMNEKLNPRYPGIAYHCGRMIAVYAEIQKKALGDDVGAGVLQRYYASASRAPGLVIGQLSKLSTYHLSKIEDKRSVKHFENLLSDITTAIGTEKVSSSLTVEQQTEFALGYYQQKAAMWNKT